MHNAHCERIAAATNKKLGLHNSRQLDGFGPRVLSGAK